MSFLKIRNLTKSYVKNGVTRLVIDITQLDLDKGQQMVLVGKSGLGKSTLLHLIAGLSEISSGEIFLDGIGLHDLSESKRDRLRGQKIGMIFQRYHLLPGLTAIENVIAGVMLRKSPDIKKAEELLNRLGLEERLNDYPHTLSSGQQQRVAIARSLVHDPILLLADEPTAGLDHENSEIVLRLLQEEAKRLGAALLLVTHDEFVKSQFETSLDLKDLMRSSV